MSIPEKYKHIDFTVTKAMKDAAERGLEYRKENNGKGGLSTQEAGRAGIGSGVARARDIINRDSLPPDTWKQIHRFFSRHAKNIEIDEGKTAKTDAGYIAGLTWGGEPARSRASKIVRQMEAADNDNHVKKACLYAIKYGLHITADNNDNKSYKDFFSEMLAQYEKEKGKSLGEMTDKETKYFFKEIIDPNWKAKDEQNAIDKNVKIENLIPGSEDYMPHVEFLHGGEADSASPEDFDKDQLAKGIEIEFEHTKNPMVAREIAMDHLMEDPKYYDYLEEMEAQFEQNAHDGDYMARSNMSQIKQHSDELFDILEEAEKNDEALQDWVEDKISAVSDDMEEIYNYFTHRKPPEEKKKCANFESVTAKKKPIGGGDSGYEPSDKKLWQKAQSWAKSTYKVHPSAYSNLAASKKYKEWGGKWKKKKKADLRHWLKEEWVDISRKDKHGKHPPCGRTDSDKGAYPKCRPKSQADTMSKKEKERATRQKRDEDNPKSGKGNKPTRDSHTKSD